MRSTILVTTFVAATAAIPATAAAQQLPGLPLPAATPRTPQQRFVDFHADLDRPGVLCVVGTLGRCKDGKRERLEEGRLGNAAQNVSVSGTQYFKVPVTAPLRAATVLHGTAKGTLQVAFDVQLARLPDGTERRQPTTPDAAAVEEGTLALWVLAPPDKGKHLALLHVLPFDAQADTGADAERSFADLMRDVVVVNERVHDLEQAVRRAQDAKGGGDERAAADALAALRAVLDAEVTMLRPEMDTVLRTNATPWEERARKLLGP